MEEAGGQGRRNFLVLAVIPAAFIAGALLIILLRGGPRSEVSVLGGPVAKRADRPGARGTGPTREADAPRASVEPEEPPAAAGPVDLLRLIDPANDGVIGTWVREGKVLVSPILRGKAASLLVPYAPPEEYDIALVAERKEGIEALHVGLVCGQSQFMVVLDANWEKGYFSGIDLVDGKGFDKNESRSYNRVFLRDKPATVVISVRRTGVAVTASGTPIIQWQGTPDRLSRGSFFKFPHPEAISLGSWESAYHVSSMILTPVSGAGKSLR